VVEGNVGYVGTNDPIVPYHEYGTSRIPARPFLGGALAAAGDEIPKIFGRLVSAAMMHGGPSKRPRKRPRISLRTIAMKTANRFRLHQRLGF
jgi:hypothetical protein